MHPVITSKRMQAIEESVFKSFSDQQLPELFVERVGIQVCHLILQKIESYFRQHGFSPRVGLLCGTGNNAADAFICGLHLLKASIDVFAIQVFRPEKESGLCQASRRRYIEQGGSLETYQGGEVNFGEKPCLLVDGLLGTGFRPPVLGFFEQVIEQINASRFPVYSIDIPSGLCGNGYELNKANKGSAPKSWEANRVAINAVETFYLEFPKFGFFLNKAWNHLGKLHRVEFGLKSFIDSLASNDAYLLDDLSVGRMLPPLLRDQHKHLAGELVVWAGSQGMEGACSLACKAALRTGCGLVRACLDSSSRGDFSLAPEVMPCLSTNQNGVDQISHVGQIEKWLNAFANADASLIGPGIGRGPGIQERFLACLSKVRGPLVLDACAIHLYSMLQPKITVPLVMTPHIGELKALLQFNGVFTFNRSSQKLIQDYCDTRAVTLVVKGAPSYLFHPMQVMRIMPRGHPGMATAGCGDVLAGILGSFLAQGIDPFDAASLATYIHGLAGELAIQNKSQRSLIASDVIEAIPLALMQIEEAESRTRAKAYLNSIDSP